MARGTGRPLTRTAAFWDASALVPLCVSENATPLAIAHYEVYDIVVWWATEIEIASALARLLRMKQLDARRWSQATNLARELADSWSTIQPVDALHANAIKLVDRYDLHAADSLQLAAAIEWCKNATHGREFLTNDRKLRDAALLCGFEVDPP
jgi:predicted nucleic acid-binding protein